MRGDVHPVAVDAAVRFLDHVAEVHADAHAQSALCRGCPRGGLERLLHGERRVHRAGGALEEREHRVARHVHHAPALRRDLLVEERARFFERGDGATGVRRHQARVSGDVGGENRREPLP